MKNIFHFTLMYIVMVGGILLFLLAFMWFRAGNVMMGAGMFIMGAVAESNYFLHRQMMKKMNK